MKNIEHEIFRRGYFPHTFQLCFYDICEAQICKSYRIIHAQSLHMTALKHKILCIKCENSEVWCPWLQTDCYGIHLSSRLSRWSPSMAQVQSYWGYWSLIFEIYFEYVFTDLTSLTRYRRSAENKQESTWSLIFSVGRACPFDSGWESEVDVAVRNWNASCRIDACWESTRWACE